MANSKPNSSSILSDNRRKAKFEHEWLKTFEAGMVLEGWEIKSLRAHKGSIRDSYVIIRHGEAFLLGATFTPLKTTSTHKTIEPTRTRKLLLKRKELSELIGAVERKGLTIIPLKVYLKGRLAKITIALSRGKKLHDKRKDEAKRDWKRNQDRIMKRN